MLQACRCHKDLISTNIDTQVSIVHDVHPKANHARNRSCRQRLQERQLLSVVALAEKILLQMRVYREVDRRERNVAQKAGARALVQPEEAKLADDVRRAFGRGTFNLGRFTLDLEANFAKQRTKSVGHRV